MARAPRTQSLLQPLVFATVLAAASGSTAQTLAQLPASQTLARYGIEAYFADSLRAGTQRVLATDGTIGRLTAGSVLVRNLYLPTRVAPTAVTGPITTAGDQRIVLPDRAFVETRGGTAMLLVPVVVIEGGGLRYVNGAFRGSIRVGVEDSLQVGSAVPLPQPISFFVAGNADSIMPADTTIAHTNLPFSAIALTEGTVSPSLSLNVRTTLHPDGVDIDVPINRDTLILDVSPRRIQGMGLEETVVALGPAPSGAGTSVQLVADRGTLDEHELTLNPSGTATTTLRSSWIGTSTVTARSVAFRDAQLPVDFVFPWIFLGVALLGGACGGFASWLQKKQSGAAWWRLVLGGALLGLIATVLYAVGVNVTPVNPTVTTGQAVVFALAGLIGYIGALRIEGARGAAAATTP